MQLPLKACTLCHIHPAMPSKSVCSGCGDGISRVLDLGLWESKRPSDNAANRAQVRLFLDYLTARAGK